MTRTQLIVGLMLLTIALAACAPTPTPQPCDGCHLITLNTAPTMGVACTEYTEAGFSGPLGSIVVSEKQGAFGQTKTVTLTWDSAASTISGSNGTSFTIAEGATVSNDEWPEELSFLNGSEMANCMGYFYFKSTPTVHVAN